MWADGGGKIRGAATRPLYGPRAVAQFALASLRYVPGPYDTEVSEVNGEPAIILRVDGNPIVVVCLTLNEDVIHEIRVIGNPDKLTHLRRGQ